jgi:hypothetical protein
MPKTAVTQWDTTPANNTDIDGINIAENCPAAGINNAIRTLMAQIATWAPGLVLKAGSAMTGDLTDQGTASTVKDAAGTAHKLGYRHIPQNPQSSAYVLALSDAGKHVAITTGGVTVPANATIAFEIGTAITIINNSASDQTITEASGVTLRRAGTAGTGNRSLAARGLATLLKIGTNEWYISGAGLA